MSIETPVIPSPLPSPYYGYPFPIEVGAATIKGISGNCYVVACPDERGVESPTTATIENAVAEVTALLDL